MNPCNQEIYDKGTVVFITNSVPSQEMEEWVKAIADKSRQPVDWSMSAGRAAVQALGDLHQVKKAIVALRHIHDEAYIKYVLSLDKSFDEEFVKSNLNKVWKYNFTEFGLWSYVCSKCQGRCLPQNHAGWDPTKEGHG